MSREHPGLAPDGDRAAAGQADSPRPGLRFEDRQWIWREHVGELLNPAEAVGELVNTDGGLFAGYYGDEEADASRMRDGVYWSGDLAYTDDRGFCWFAGRAGQWLRADGENLGTAPIERVLLRHPAIAEAAVYGVPDPVSGDQVMARVVVRDGASLTPAEFGAFLAGQGDLGPGQQPRFVRVADRLPRTPTFKVLTRLLAADRWNTSDPVWWRRGRSPVCMSRWRRSRRRRSTPGSARAHPGTWNHEDVPRTQGHSAEPLWRAIAVYRFASIGYAMLLAALNRADYSRPERQVFLAREVARQPRADTAGGRARRDDGGPRRHDRRRRQPGDPGPPGRVTRRHPVDDQRLPAGAGRLADHDGQDR
jgi:AMP-binding enzyme C-terminal domain